MTRRILIVFTRYTCSDKEYHDWYDNEHIPGALAVPGVVSAQRFAFSNIQLPVLGDQNPGYLAIYELEGNIQAIVDQLMKTLKIPKFLVMPAQAWIFESITDAVTGRNPR